MHHLERQSQKREIRELTQQDRPEDIISKQRLRWTGHVMKTAKDRIARKMFNWVPPHNKRPGRPHTDYEAGHQHRRNWRGASSTSGS
jgi:hypothetical protein